MRFIFFSLLLRSFSFHSNCLDVAASISLKRVQGKTFSCDPNPELGSGSSGSAYKLVDQEGNFVVAKVVRLKDPSPAFDSEKKLQKFWTEVEALQKIESPHVIRLWQAFEEGDFGYQLLEFADLGTLRSYIDTHSSELEDPAKVLELLLQLLVGLQAVHQANLVHADLKPKNIVLKMEKGKIVVKIIDFDLAVQMNSRRSRRGTLGYEDPRCQISPCTYDEFSDVYSLGVVLYSMVTAGKKPFDGATTLEVDIKVRKGSFQIVSGTHWFIGFLITACLSPDPANRPSVHELIDWVTHALKTPHWLRRISLGQQKVNASAPAKTRAFRLSTKNQDTYPIPQLVMKDHLIVISGDTPHQAGHQRSISTHTRAIETSGATEIQENLVKGKGLDNFTRIPKEPVDPFIIKESGPKYQVSEQIRPKVEPATEVPLPQEGGLGLVKTEALQKVGQPQNIDLESDGPTKIREKREIEQRIETLKQQIFEKLKKKQQTEENRAKVQQQSNEGQTKIAQPSKITTSFGLFLRGTAERKRNLGLLGKKTSWQKGDSGILIFFGFAAVLLASVHAVLRWFRAKEEALDSWDPQPDSGDKTKQGRSLTISQQKIQENLGGVLIT